MNIAELLAGPVAERGDAPALMEGTGAERRETSFAALDLAARRIAATFRRDGVGSGDGVLFFAAPSAALYASLIAVFRRGAVAMFVEPSAGRRVLDDACDMWPPRALVATRKAHLLRLVSRPLRKVPAKYTTAGWIPGARSLGADEGAPDDMVAAVDADAPALVTFTSGSTGRPKGVVRTHGILRAQLAALSESLAARAAERELVSLPVVVLLNLANGAETVLPDADLRRPAEIDAPRVLAQMTRERITRATASPAFLERLADDAAATRAFAGIDAVVTGGGPVFPDIVARLSQCAPSARIVSVYGSTEAEPIAHIEAAEVSTADQDAMRRGAGLLAGSPDPCVDLRIIRRQWGTPIPPLAAAAFDAMACATGEPGEIVVAGAHVVRGYLHGRGDDETKFRVDGRVWHRTGDLGYLDAGVRLWLLGRASAVIEDSHGVVYPFAVECVAREVLGVRRSAMIGKGGRRLLVIERAPSDPAIEPAATRETLAWAKIDEVVVVPKLPMDRRHNSKVDYGALTALLDPGGARS
ncbi:MAG TPA: AMP-binding protein [Gemmatimonadaceae bacterium]|nr:AMP-binding protein [Gemmatimonadaceae bacterium]